MSGCLSKILAIFFGLLIFICLGLAASQGPEQVDISDFESIRSAIEPHLDDWFDRAKEIEQQGDSCWTNPDAGYSVHNKCCILDIDEQPINDGLGGDAYVDRIYVDCRKDEAGTTFHYVVIVTGSVRDWWKGYIYNPSSKSLNGDGLRTKQIEGSWFVFTWVD